MIEPKKVHKFALLFLDFLEKRLFLVINNYKEYWTFLGSILSECRQSLRLCRHSEARNYILALLFIVKNFIDSIYFCILNLNFISFFVTKNNLSLIHY